MGQPFFQIVLGVLVANAVTLLGVYSLAKMNRTELNTGQASVRYIVMWLICLAVTGLIALIALN